MQNPEPLNITPLQPEDKASFQENNTNINKSLLPNIRLEVSNSSISSMRTENCFKIKIDHAKILQEYLMQHRPV